MEYARMSANRITLGYQTQTVRIEVARMDPLLEVTFYDADDEQHGLTIYMEADDVEELVEILERLAGELRPA